MKLDIAIECFTFIAKKYLFTSSHKETGQTVDLVN